MKHALLGRYSYVEFGACVVGFLPVMALAHHLHRDDPTQRVPGRWMRRLGRTTGRLTPLWDFVVEGEPPADIRETPYVVVANHESTADPFLLSWLPWDMRWVAKEELFKPPVTGWAFRFGGDIPLRRGQGESVRQMLDECSRAMDAGISIMIFPEGTRSKDGSLLPFKTGAFSLAIRKRAKILPIAVAGTRQMRPKGSLWFGRARACAKILGPISSDDYAAEDAASLAEVVRVRMSDALAELRPRYGYVSPDEQARRK